MMAGTSGSSGGGASGGTSGATGTAVGAPAVNTTLRREVHSAASMIQVQPLNLGVPGLATLDFYITLNSHGESLAVDLPATARLRVPSGQYILPLQWVGPTAGKHIEGTLSFALTNANGSPAIPSSGPLVLVVDNVAVSGLQRFVWDLGGLR